MKRLRSCSIRTERSKQLRRTTRLSAMMCMCCVYCGHGTHQQQRRHLVTHLFPNAAVFLSLWAVQHHVCLQMPCVTLQRACFCCRCRHPPTHRQCPPPQAARAQSGFLRDLRQGRSSLHQRRFFFFYDSFARGPTSLGSFLTFFVSVSPSLIPHRRVKHLHTYTVLPTGESICSLS